MLAIGEAKAGEAVGLSHLKHPERARTALAAGAASAELLLFAARFARELHRAAASRSDEEQVDFERMYRGN